MSANIRACIKGGQGRQKAFDLLRKSYPLRREWSAHEVTGMSLSYQPTCSIDALKAHAWLAYPNPSVFAERGVMEVELP